MVHDIADINVAESGKSVYFYSLMPEISSYSVLTPHLNDSDFPWDLHYNRNNLDAF